MPALITAVSHSFKGGPWHDEVDKTTSGLTTAEIYEVVVLPDLDGVDDLFHQVKGGLSINLPFERWKGVSCYKLTHGHAHSVKLWNRTLCVNHFTLISLTSVCVCVCECVT